ncbi:hypothetical protein SFC76_14050 [Sphingomonas sp. CD22]|uniref:hypothetical protein n=1 Tax=Sphingomonas sp. CD22 TaxID=3100214 RepID=UPI002ADF5CC8|nr:hypothetical protein [Sphingomonas sp. CD22]MEA1085384.1 hypothetical protein [Sphingomonas sp. CD22]
MRRLTTMSVVIGAALLYWPSASSGQISALSTDCKAGGPRRGLGVYQFVATCAGRAPSPDGRLAIVQRAYRDRQPPIELQDANGRIVARLGNLSDDMPFTVMWSPDSHWVAVNHHVGSFMDELKIFEIVGRTIIERPRLTNAARQQAVQRFRCLSPSSVLPNAIRWSKDGHRLAMVTISSQDACSETAKRGDWRPLWMIGDVRTGRIDPASVRVDKADGPLREPRDPLYRGF